MLGQNLHPFGAKSRKYYRLHPTQRFCPHFIFGAEQATQKNFPKIH